MYFLLSQTFSLQFYFPTYFYCKNILSIMFTHILNNNNIFTYVPKQQRYNFLFLALFQFRRPNFLYLLFLSFSRESSLYFLLLNQIFKLRVKSNSCLYNTIKKNNSFCFGIRIPVYLDPECVLDRIWKSSQKKVEK